jgi:signal transduction histidine kinase
MSDDRGAPIAGLAVPAPVHAFWRDLWARTAIEGAGLLVVYFVVWFVVERAVFANAAPSLLLDALHLTRGVGAALMLGTWSFLRIRRARVHSDADTHEHMAYLEAQIRHQEKMAGLGMLTAGFAHDLGNPLASLSTELELLEGEDDAAQLRASLGVLRTHVARMSRTLREMVDFARRRRDEISDVSIAAAVSDSARLVHHDPRWKNVELRVDVPNDVPSVHMVEDHLVLVLVNLMLNAADAMPTGGALDVSAARTAGADVELRVRDTGTGMTADVLERAKSPLFTTKSAARGTGLGLSVCDGIVRSVGGTLDIASTAGAGTEVVIRLPRAPVLDG